MDDFQLLLEIQRSRAVLLGKVPMAVRQKPLSGWTTIILLKVLLENFLETIRLPMLL